MKRPHDRSIPRRPARPDGPLLFWLRRFATLMLAMMLTLGGACGVRSNVLQTNDAGPLATIARWTSAVCTMRRTCCGPEPDALNALASCEADLEAAFGLTDGVEGGRLVVDQAVLGRCEAAVKTARCAAAVPELEPCRGALKGTVSSGGVCHSDYECARGSNGEPALCFKGTMAFGDEVLPAATGQCRPSPLANAGERCVLSLDYDFDQPGLSGDPAAWPATFPRCSRARGLVCGADSTCVAAPGLGDACTQFFNECGSGLACSCGLCQANQPLHAAMAPFCVDGACTITCPQPVASSGGEYCNEAVDPDDGKCHVPYLYCGYTADCPASWAVAQSLSSCPGADDTVVLGTCGDTDTWRSAVFEVTCYYDDRSGRLVGVVNEKPTDQYCYGVSPAQAKLFAGHIPANCPEVALP